MPFLIKPTRPSDKSSVCMVPFLVHAGYYGVGYDAVSDLYSGLILYNAGDILANRLDYISWRIKSIFQQGLIVKDNGI
jgi:hypothetical protein